MTLDSSKLDAALAKADALGMKMDGFSRKDQTSAPAKLKDGRIAFISGDEYYGWTIVEKVPTGGARAISKAFNSKAEAEEKFRSMQ